VQSEPIAIEIPPEVWTSAAGDDSRLICVISINGTPMHLEAIRVRYEGRRRVQQSASLEHASDFDLLCRYGSEGRFETTTINRKRYVLVATPLS
jgi:hypothetical protein